MNKKYACLFDRLMAHSEESEEYSYNGTPCWCWKNRLRRAYGRLTVRQPGREKPVPVWAHRAMAELVLGRELDKETETIEHLCAIPWCINYMHFALAPRKDNTIDARARQLGRPSPIVFTPMITAEEWHIPVLVRALPTRRVATRVLEEEACPF